MDPELGWENGNVCWGVHRARFQCSKEDRKKSPSSRTVSCLGVMPEQLQPPGYSRMKPSLRSKGSAENVHAQIPLCFAIFCYVAP